MCDTLNAKDTLVSGWDFQNQSQSDGRIMTSNGHDNATFTLDYSSSNSGIGNADFSSELLQSMTPNATVTSTIDAIGKETLVMTSNYLHDRDETQHLPNNATVGIWKYTHSGNQKEVFTNKYTADGTVTGTLQPDESVVWSGNGNQLATSKFKYTQDSLHYGEVRNLIGGGGGIYNSIRDAHFDRTATLTGVLNPNSGVFDNTFAVSGDPYVTVTGHTDYNLPWPKTELELALETIFTSASTGYPSQQDPPLNGGLPPDYQYPSNPASTGWLSWFGGTSGDAGDQAIYFTAGVADQLTMNISYATRNAVGGDGIDYNSNGYYVGDKAGLAIGLVSGGAGAAQGLKALATSTDDAGRCANWLSKLWQGGCFVAGTLVTLSDMPRSQATDDDVWSMSDPVWNGDNQVGDSGPDRQRSSATALIESPSRMLVPIEQVPLGARVPTKNPKPWEYDDSLPEPDEATWSKISITIERTDGGIVDAELLRPQSWVKSYGLEAGKLLPLNIAELQISGLATVTAIDRCPTISTGEGSVITARFLTRQVDVIVRAEILGADDTIEVIEGTPIHPIWSVDRNDWVTLGELVGGEKLLSRNDFSQIVFIAVLRASSRVYNLEIFGDHVYEIGTEMILVHNACEDRLVDVRKLMPSLSRDFADPVKLERMGAFDWAKYKPIELIKEAGGLRVQAGMTRIEAALRAGITHLPAKVFSS